MTYLYKKVFCGLSRLRRWLAVFVFVAFSLANGLLAQALHGRVIAEDDAPLEFVSVALLSQQDSTVLTGCTTQADGTWSMEAGDSKACMLKVSLAGYVTQYFTMPFPQTIKLKASSTAMQEVQVAATRKYVKANLRGITVQMDGNPLSQLPTTLDALREMPLIEGTGTNLTVLGHGTPEMYIGQRKVQDISEVQQLSPADIKSVEIITHPGVRYGQDVNSVVIIHLKRKHPGLAGYVSGTGTVAEVLSGQAATGLSYTLRSGLSLYANANGGSDGFSQSRTYNESNALASVFSRTEGTYSGRTKSLGVAVGGSQEFARGHSLGMRYSYSRTPSSLYESDASNVSANSAATSWLSTQSRSTSQSWRHYFNAYTNLKLSKPLTLTADADYLWGHAPSHGHIQEHDSTPLPWTMDTRNLKDYRMAAVKADLDGTWKRWSMQAGARYTYTRSSLAFDSQASEGTAFMQATSNWERQNLYALYGSATYQPNEHWAVNGGVRCEVTDFDYKQDGKPVEGQNRTYADWMPEVGVRYMHKELALGLLYDTHTYRPSYSSLNSDYIYITHTSWTTGNPLLRNALLKRLKASLSWRQTYASLSYCRMVRNTESVYTYLPEYDVNLMQEVNLPTFNRFVLIVSHSFDVKWWHPTVQGQAQVSDLKYGEGEWHRSYNKPYYALTLQNRFDLPWQMYAWLGCSLMGRGNNSTLEYYQETISAYLQLSKTLGHWNLSLLLYDPTRTAGQKYRILTNGVSYREWRKGSTTMLQLSARYTFNYKNKREYKGQGAAADEMQRFQ